MRVAIIGSGLLGVATAWFLRRRGAEVTVLERRDRAAQETSFANAGMLTPSMSDPWNAPGLLGKLVRGVTRENSAMVLRLAALPAMAAWGLRFLRNSAPARYRAHTLLNLRLARHSLGVLRELRQELGIEHDALANGTLKLFRERADMEPFLALARLLAEEGIEHRELDAAQTVALEPSLAGIEHKLSGALHYPGDESGDARIFCEALAGHAQRAGVEFRFGVAVRDWRYERSRISALLTDHGAVAADTFVLCAGSYSPLLLRRLGLRLPIRPVKGYSITFDAANWPWRPRRPLIDEGLHAAVTPLGGRLRVAGTAELAGYDTAIRPARIENLKHMLRELFPGCEERLDSLALEEWAGLRPMSADGVPVIGPTAFENLYLNTGHGHLGWTLSCGSGELLAELIHGRSTALDLAPYGMGRF